MLELGAVSGAEHRRVAALAGTLGVEFVAVGTDEYGVPRETEADVERMLDELGEGDAVLVKGSRAAGLERLASSLAAAGAGTKTATRTATRTATEW
jgi:UDP-N-acetylmuramoyl-tripeptide--D-alanyl-D-alanine ligase